MAISTYAELQSAIADWLGRSDLTVAQVTNLISIFEAVANRNLRVNQQETLTTLTPDSNGEVALPTDYLAWRRLTWAGDSSRELEFANPHWLNNAYTTSATGTPVFFTIEEFTIKVRPIDDTDLDLLYFAKIPALSTDVTTNWLLTAHPDAYLFGSLAEANAFLLNVEGALLWKQRRDEVFDEIKRLSEKTKGPAAMRPMMATP